MDPIASYHPQTMFHPRTMSAQRWADGINMWPNAVGTFNRPLASV